MKRVAGLLFVVAAVTTGTLMADHRGQNQRRALAWGRPAHSAGLAGRGGPYEHDIFITGDGRGEGLPPGLARRGGNLPPGLRRHIERTGHLPPGLEKRRGDRFHHRVLDDRGLFVDRDDVRDRDEHRRFRQQRREEQR